jgi:hypothetical protein
VNTNRGDLIFINTWASLAKDSILFVWTRDYIDKDHQAAETQMEETQVEETQVEDAETKVKEPKEKKTRVE